MRQVTGKTNLPESGYKVSIQQSLDGHSFSVPSLPETISGGEVLEAEILTAQTMLVPAEYFTAEGAAELLAAGGISLHEDQCVVWSDPAAEVVALMAMPGMIRERLVGISGGRIRYTTPLLTPSGSGGKCVWILRSGHLLYIKVYAESGALRLAEVIPAPEEADIRYLFERLAALFPLNEHTLYAAGDFPKSLRKEIGHLFKKTICA